MKCDHCKHEKKDYVITRKYDNDIHTEGNLLCKNCITIQSIYMAERCRKENKKLYNQFLKIATEHLKRDHEI